MDTIETILKKEFPELQVETHISGDITQHELEMSIRYIRDNKLIQDAQQLLNQTKPIRESVTYPLFFFGQDRAFNFKVDWVQGPMIFIGYLRTTTANCKDVSQARLYAMRIRQE